jgi:hypothetical protein
VVIGTELGGSAPAAALTFSFVHLLDDRKSLDDKYSFGPM